MRTTRPLAGLERPADLVGRVFAVPAPDRLWVADITYVRMVTGFAYTAFGSAAYARRIVGWRVAATLGAGLALDALELAAWSPWQAGPRRARPSLRPR